MLASEPRNVGLSREFEQHSFALAHARKLAADIEMKPARGQTQASHKPSELGVKKIEWVRGSEPLISDGRDLPDEFEGWTSGCAEQEIGSARAWQMRLIIHRTDLGQRVQD